MYSLIFFLTLVSAACGGSYGNKLESEELDVFYTKIQFEEDARKIALYWKEHALLGTQKQYLQLDEHHGVYHLKLVSTDNFDPTTFSFDERALLKSLQDSLQAVVAPKRLEIVIAKNNFETVFNIN